MTDTAVRATTQTWSRRAADRARFALACGAILVTGAVRLAAVLPAGPCWPRHVRGIIRWPASVNA
jgi:hypothetical protein